MATGPFRFSREVYVPQLENGFLHYTMMEIIGADSGWAVKDLPAQPFPNATGPSAIVGITAMDGLGTERISQSGYRALPGRGSWAGSSVNLE